jgi:two-component sensor histidine kinase
MTNLGRSQMIRNDSDKAMEYFTASLSIATKRNDKSIIAYTLENIGDIWTIKNPKRAIDYFSKALVFANELNDVSLISSLYMSLGDTYNGMKDYNKAYNYYKLGIGIAKENSDKELTVQLLNSIGLVLINKKDYEKAIGYLEQALATNENYGLKIPLSNTYKELSEAYAKLNNYDKAYHYHLLHTTVDSSIFNTERERASVEITSKYNIEKKVKEILVLKKDNEIKNLQLSNNQLILLAAAVICILLLIIFIIFYKKFQIKRKANEEKEVMLREIHHRVKNNMQIILSILSLQARKSNDEKAMSFLKESESRIQSMAIIHEMLYQSHNLANISFNDYICQLVDYIFKIYNVNTDKIKYKVVASAIHLDINTAVPLGLIVNELVCNSLKHAFGNKDTGMIIIQLTNVKPKEYELIISDTGTGLPENFEIKKTNTLGLKLIQTLTKQIEGKLTITSKEGVVFSISFKEIT